MQGASFDDFNQINSFASNQLETHTLGSLSFCQDYFKHRLPSG